MSRWRFILVGILVLLAMLPALISSMAWGGVNIAYALLIIGCAIWLIARMPKVALLGLPVLAILLTLLPYPYWLFMDNSGSYSIRLNYMGLRDSWGFLAGLSFAYLIVLISGCSLA